MAAAYARARIATFPVGGPDGKRPLVKQPQAFGCRASLRLVDLGRFDDANIAFWCGPRSGLTIIDVDTDQIAELDWVLETFGATPAIVRTGSGKFHAFYRHAGEPRLIRPFTGHPIDVLGSGGLCVAPPSVKPGGGAYTFWRGDLDALTDLPRIAQQGRALIDGATNKRRQVEAARAASREPSEQASPAQTGPHEQTRADLDGRIPEGARNNAAFRQALRVAKQEHRAGGNLERVLDQLRRWNPVNCDPPLADAEIVTVATSAWNYTLDGRNWVDEAGHVYLSAVELDHLSPHPEALVLWTRIKQLHGKLRSTIALAPKAMAGKKVIARWSAQRYRRAIGTLCQLGAIRRRTRGGARVGDAAQYEIVGFEG